MKPGTPFLQSTRLLDQVREQVLYKHYSLKNREELLLLESIFIRWSATLSGGMRHPREMGVADVEAFLSMLANERKVLASTDNQAHSMGADQGRGGWPFGAVGWCNGAGGTASPLDSLLQV